jgi:tripartite-type tricarboxylate transporter receptor subunit TctC
MSWKSIRPDWVRDGQIRVLAQAGLRKDPDLPDTPLFLDLATTADDKAMVQLLSLPIATSRAVLLPPEVPADRVELMRRAFDATLKDPDFLKEAKERQMDIKAMTGEEVQAAMEEMFQTPEHVIERAKAALDY